MLLAEDPLDLLIDRLRALPPIDRLGVLARLSVAERRRVEEALQRRPAEPCLAPDIAARITTGPTDRSMTPAAREALLRIAGDSVPMAMSAETIGPSLFDRLSGALRRR